ncbi:serine hydrolase domain-containing protein [Pseudoxanthomonas beigongshangi]
MRSFFLLSMMAALGLAWPGARAQSASPEPASPAAAVRALLAPWDRPGLPGVAVSITLDGQVVQHEEAGMADLEQGTPITPDSAFQIASVSKQFTAFAILLLEQDGRLSIDAPLSDYLPEAARWSPMTLRQLLNHTAGVRDFGTLMPAAGWRDEDLLTDDQVLRIVLRQRDGNFAPGAAYQYNNTDYALLGEVVRRVSGKSLRVFCDERIFQPLDMRDTRFADDLGDRVPHRVPSWQSSGQSSGTGYIRAVLSATTTGSTGLVTTTADLSRWALNFETHTVGNAALFARMQEQGRLADGTLNFYALGQERHAWRGLDTWSHGGRDAGYRSFLLRIPGEHFSVAVVANANDIDTSEIAYGIAERYLSHRPGYRAPSPDNSRPSRRQLASYAGDYELFPGYFFRVGTDGRHLLLSTLDDAKPERLPALSARRFLLSGKFNQVLEFPDEGAGPPARLHFVIGQYGRIDALRKTLAAFDPAGVRIDDFTGRYRSDELDTDYVLTAEAGRLLVNHPRWPAATLQPYQRDLFRSSAWFLQKIAFRRDASGRVTGFLLSGPVAENIVFERTADR